MIEKYCSLAEKVRLISQANRALSPTKKRLAGFRVELTRYGPMISSCSVLGLKDILTTVDLNKLASSSMF